MAGTGPRGSLERLEWSNVWDARADGTLGTEKAEMQGMVDDDIDTSKAVVAVMAVMGWVGPLMGAVLLYRQILERSAPKAKFLIIDGQAARNPKKCRSSNAKSCGEGRAITTARR